MSVSFSPDIRFTNGFRGLYIDPHPDLEEETGYQVFDIQIAPSIEVHRDYMVIFRRLN
jgi:hypothetical protein